MKNKIVKLKKVLKKQIPVWAVVLILFVSMTAFALTIYTIEPEKISIFQGTVTNTDFIVDSAASKIVGRHTVIITLVLKNTDTNSHSANVTVQLLNSSGYVIAEDTKEVSDVSGGQYVVLLYTFTKENLVSEYEGYQVVIYQYE